MGKVTPEQVLPPMLGPAWGYRNRARLSVHYVAKKGGVLVGFHERALELRGGHDVVRDLAAGSLEARA